MHFYQEVGKRIERMRKEKGYSREKLAELVYIKIDVLIAFENGRMRIFIDQISKLADVLGVTTDYLIYGAGKSD